MSMSVSDVALRTPVTATPEQLICEVERLLIDSLASEVYVIDQAENLLGIVSDDAFLQYHMLGGDGQGRIATLMSPVAHSLPLNASLEDAARLLRDPLSSSIPILHEQRLIGQICRSNLLRIILDHGYELAEAPLTADVHHIPHPKLNYGVPPAQRTARLISKLSFQ
ncbi:CBS domain-containing protein [Planctomicrobium sp. SH668]|uniref:CBS domain-containing protein n=1 Tax=Planctomicrobium sp. SH668 TaxID=3448126 RepID=UPI003F5C3D96